MVLWLSRSIYFYWRGKDFQRSFSCPTGIPCLPQRYVGFRYDCFHPAFPSSSKTPSINLIHAHTSHLPTSFQQNKRKLTWTLIHTVDISRMHGKHHEFQRESLFQQSRNDKFEIQNDCKKKHWWWFYLERWYFDIWWSRCLSFSYSRLLGKLVYCGKRIVPGVVENLVELFSLWWMHKSASTFLSDRCLALWLFACEKRERTEWIETRENIHAEEWNMRITEEVALLS